MKRQNLFTCGIVLGSILISGNSFGDNGHYIVRLKGNILCPGYTHKPVNIDKPASDSHTLAVRQAVPKGMVKQVPHLRVVNHIVQPTVVKPTQPEAVKQVAHSSVVKTVQAEVVSQELQHNNSSRKPGKTYVSLTNYEQRQATIHSSIFGILPGTYIDSMRIVNHLLIDSIRNVLSVNSGTANTTGGLKLSLVNSIKDSAILSRLNTLLSAEEQEKISPRVLVAHCKDVFTSSAVDSVEMDVFSGGTLVTSGISDRSGTIEAQDIPAGNYYAIFSRKRYSTVSLMHINITSAGQSYIDVPLREESVLSPVVAKNGWFFIVSWGIILLLTMIILAYRLAKYTEKRSLVKQFKVDTSAI